MKFEKFCYTKLTYTIRVICSSDGLADWTYYADIGELIGEQIILKDGIDSDIIYWLSDRDCDIEFEGSPKPCVLVYSNISTSELCEQFNIKEEYIERAVPPKTLKIIAREFNFTSAMEVKIYTSAGETIGCLCGKNVQLEKLNYADIEYFMKYLLEAPAVCLNRGTGKMIIIVDIDLEKYREEEKNLFFKID